MIHLHERHLIVRTAVSEARQALWAVLDKHKLTTAEVILVVTEVCSDEMSSIARASIRAERHPDDPEKPGDEA